MKLWIARQKWGGLFLFRIRPYKNEDENGDKIHFTHRLTAINWSEADLELLT
jgi:hypothetical protein